jgi:hypothetical protein
MAYYILNQFLRAHVPGFEEAVIVSTAAELGVRTSRKISAEYNLKNSRDLRDKHFPDVIGVFCPQQTYLTEIPYRSLIPLKVDNLLVASGRSFPNDKVPAHPYRETPVVVIMGQAAGVAAALAARTGITPRTLDYRNIQKELLKQDVYLGP